MSEFLTACDYVLSNEGGLVDNHSDAGGITNFGISLRFLKNLELQKLKECGLLYHDEYSLIDFIKKMDVEIARKIYKVCFWDDFYFSKINNQSVTNYYFDTAVNCGMAHATKMIQRAIHAHNISSNVVDDGVFGVNTLEEINHCGFMVLAPFRSERSNYYRMLVFKNPNQEQFLDGWLRRTYK